MNSSPPIDALLATLRGARAEVEQRFGVRLIGVLGSMVRGEATADSDIDIAFEALPGTSLFGVGEALLELQALLARRVDLVDPSALAQERRALLVRDYVAL